MVSYLNIPAGGGGAAIIFLRIMLVFIAYEVEAGVP